jgi:cell division protein FtsW (lipid II flippase)
MGKTQGEKNKETYDFYYKKGKMDSRKVYTNKIYDKRFTEEDKEEAESHFAYRKRPMTSKHFLMFVIMCILFLFFGHFYFFNEDNITPILFIIIFFFVAVGLFYNVKSNFYILLLGLIVITLLIVSGLVTKAYNYAVVELLPDKNKANNNKANNNKTNNKANK